jgi:hypothetical protein
MIQAYLKKKGATQLPASCTMYTSLESCHMCAGFAAEVGNGLRVIYGQKDDQIINNALERKVKASSQAPTTTRFNPSGVPTRLATPIASGAKPGLAPGASMDVISRLRNEFKELDKFTGVTKFLFSDLGKYFYDIEQKVPGTTVGRLGEIAKAPNLPKPTPAPYRPGFLDPVRVTPTPSPLAHLDLAMPRREPRPEDREAMNRKLFGAEMDLARYALQFLDTLRKQGVFG